ncbi:CidA/LrgA family protein [Fictibacillus fluitans]|uniref:CidA/LrgA family protein n=1 Tax=Fictibacillus fluitans TaxID=3058422 RepID=A0ABT8HY79_9BACL|nr:CidA/LrgA family protein [Fictibacillus sp. NE201]MDN4525729.1 CidA/LrgA family protein [Fictibacillus sp. NE201]
MKFVTGLLQVAAITLLFLLGNAIANYASLPLPGSMIGLVLLFLLLVLRVIKLEWVEQGANWLLAEFLLFFIPSAVGVVDYKDMIGGQWWKLLAVIALSTITVMAFTGLTAQWIAKRRKDVPGESSSHSS